MADEPENHTIRLLREMREETNRRFDEMRTETNRRFDEMREENAAFRKETGERFAENEQRHAETRAENDQRHAETREQLGHVLSAVVAMAKTVNVTAEAVTTIAAVQEQHSTALGKLIEGQQIIEHDIRGIKMRVDRIEKHTGLVKA